MIYLLPCIAIGVSLLVSLILTPIIRELAIKVNFVDNPDGGRKAQKKPIALGGGLAVFLSLILGFLAASFVGYYNDYSLFTKTDYASFGGLFLASLLLVGVGLLDDRTEMRGRYKLLGQIAAGMLLILISNQYITSCTVSGYEIQFGMMAIPFTLFWLLSTINAINLIDGIDGLASSVGAVLCVTVAAIALLQGNVAEAMVVLATAGALIGFLRYNFVPASIYLGDTGSMLIGLIIGAVAMMSAAKSAAAIALIVPLAIWSIPMIDTSAAILRRKLTGRSLFAADRGHLHHSLLVRGWSVRQAVIFIGLVCATTCLGGAMAIYFDREIFAVGTIVLVLVFLVRTKTFGHHEFKMIKNRIRFSTRGIARKGNENQSHRNGSLIQSQGSEEWDSLWGAVLNTIENQDLLRVQIAINLPSMHEVFFATWACSKTLPAETLKKKWSYASPLLVDGALIGNIEVEGASSALSSIHHMAKTVELLEPMEADILTIMNEIKDRQKNQAGLESSTPRELTLGTRSNS